MEGRLKALSIIRQRSATMSQRELSSMENEESQCQHSVEVNTDLNMYRAQGPANNSIWRMSAREVLQVYLTDIFLLISFVTVILVTHFTEPRRVFLKKADLQDYSFPAQPNTVPTFMVTILGIIFPATVIIGCKLTSLHRSIGWYECWQTVIALLFATLLAGSITNCIKIAVGRPRPNFASQCWPTSQPVLDPASNIFGGYPVCQSKINSDFLRSFPSGHSSWSASGLGFLTFWALGQTRVLAGQGRPWKTALCLLPAIGAIAVGVTRVTDHWHHVTDVCTGLALGFVVAFVFYRQLFPSWTSEDCDAPHCAGARLTPPDPTYALTSS